MARNELSPIAEVIPSSVSHVFYLTSKERFFRVDGDILSMEFLHPRPEDGNKMILLLLVAFNQTTHAVCYDWDANGSLRHATPRMTSRTLPFEHRLPTMVIPLTKHSSFILVSSTSLLLYKNKLDPQIQPIRYPLCIPDRESHRLSLCTQWARPLRNWLYSQGHDDIYLCREDGTLFFVEIGKEGDVENQVALGQLDSNIDTAFATLDIGQDGGDLLLAAGSMGDGGLYLQNAREQPRCIQKFMNWAPITDFVMVTPKAHRKLSTTDAAEDRLFVCSASTVGKGGLFELRHGVEAQIGLVVPLEELSNTRDMWAMTDSMHGGMYILTSDPISSILFRIPANFEEISAIDESDSGLDSNAPSLAAGCTPDGVLMQVTERSIHLGTVDLSISNYRFDYGPDQTVVVAVANGPASLILTAVRSQHQVHLHSMAAVAEEQGELRVCDIGHPVEVNEEPICALIEGFGSAYFVFLGTGHGNVLVYLIDQDGLVFLSSFAVTISQDDDLSKAIETLAVVNNTAVPDSQIKSTLFCGLRSGFLVAFEVTVDGGNGSAIGKTGSMSVVFIANVCCNHRHEASCSTATGANLRQNTNSRRICAGDLRRRVLASVAHPGWRAIRACAPTNLDHRSKQRKPLLLRWHISDLPACLLSKDHRQLHNQPCA